MKCHMVFVLFFSSVIVYVILSPIEMTPHVLNCSNNLTGQTYDYARRIFLLDPHFLPIVAHFEWPTNWF